MSELQPKRLGKSVITKQQIIDALNVAEINNPEFLKNAFEKYTEGASSNPYKYVSNKKLYNYKKQMEEYVENICKKAKKTKTEKVTTEFIEKAKNRNILLNGVNFVAGFAVAAAFLSTIIPKVQYWVTKQKTGVDAFPGTYDYENNREIEF
jgi:L-lactate utilization protein LutC